MKKIIIGIIILALLGAAAFFMYKAGYLDKYINKVSIQDTPNVVESMRNISELTSACFYEEIVQSEPIKKSDSLIVVIKGKVRAGFQLGNLNEENIEINGDTLSITLPEAQIFDVIVNPSDIRYIDGEKSSTEKVLNKAISKARKRIQEDAIKDGILDKATESGIKQLRELFKAFGFAEVYVDIE